MAEMTEPDGDVNMPALVRSAQHGDVTAFARLVEQHQVGLTRFCRRLMGDASAGEDLAQETLLRAQQSIGRLGEPYRFGPWLFGIAANLARKVWRAEARRPLSLEALISAYPNVPWDESHRSVPSPEQLSEEAEETRLLLDAIGSLPAALSRVVVLHYLNGLNYAEVAAALDVPISTVKGRLFESRTRLRRELSAGGLCPIEAPPRRKPRPKRGGLATMPAQTAGSAPKRRIRVEVDLDPLVDEALAFITLPWPRPDPAAALPDLGSPRNRFVPLQILEQMVLDGVAARRDVSDFLAAVFDPHQFDVRWRRR
jgi:RNA polymerase sigma-70 factor (ECF subfamily)